MLRAERDVLAPPGQAQKSSFEPIVFVAVNIYNKSCFAQLRPVAECGISPFLCRNPTGCTFRIIMFVFGHILL